MIIGVAGGIGSGKTSVAEIFKVDKFGIIHADLIAAEIRQDPEVKNKFVEALGDDILSDGDISKEKLLEAILTDTLRPKVNAIMHPEIKLHIEQRIKLLVHEGFHDIVIDAPIFSQLGLKPLVDILIYVKSNLGNRIMRIKKRKHYIESTISKLIFIQGGEESLEAEADYVIDNSGTENELRDKVFELINVIRERRI